MFIFVPFSFPLERRSPCPPSSLSAWALTRARRQCASTATWMSKPAAIGDGWDTEPFTLVEKDVFGVEPDLTREGCSIPATLTFQEAIGRNVMLLPMGSSDDGAHSQNEKFNRTNYIQGIKMLGAYFHEVSLLE
ncbi:cytosolic non-specific dipeptidase-like [Oncorhynchus keta]|uniref:cytosolic non-specific dipeptidase-like n=1 Tax=Oncorhynchus keta TaxID=8018 RepID=UPI00227D45D5|nr:cytosolic non-specific dipeptidase-like [Oncorhynchus keta]